MRTDVNVLVISKTNLVLVGILKTTEDKIRIQICDKHSRSATFL
jgi:hypothetical protein